jgi:hypothetical protein
LSKNPEVKNAKYEFKILSLLVNSCIYNSNIHFVRYKQTEPDQKAVIKMQSKEKSEETYSHLKEDVYSNSIIKAKISNEEIFENVSKLNSFPRPPHKENYNIRVTVLDEKKT